jgi:hypothetical protein
VSPDGVIVLWVVIDLGIVLVVALIARLQRRAFAWRGRTLDLFRFTFVAAAVAVVLALVVGFVHAPTWVRWVVALYNVFGVIGGLVVDGIRRDRERVKGS